MRRSDREMGREFALKVIDEAPWAVVSVADGNRVHAVPLSVVRIDEDLYFHCAHEGRKAELYDGNPDVTAVFVSQAAVPHLFTQEELEAKLSDETFLGQILSKIFTTTYSSAIVEGTIEKIVDDRQKTRALRAICEKYTPHAMDYFDAAILSSLNMTAVYRIPMNQVTAKRKAFDASGEEMKWGRME